MSDESDTVLACPNCDVANLEWVPRDRIYRCKRCLERTSDPEERPRRASSHGGGLSPAGRAALEWGRRQAGEGDD